MWDVRWILYRYKSVKCMHWIEMVLMTLLTSCCCRRTVKLSVRMSRMTWWLKKLPIKKIFLNFWALACRGTTCPICLTYTFVQAQARSSRLNVSVIIWKQWMCKNSAHSKVFYVNVSWRRCSWYTYIDTLWRLISRTVNGENLHSSTYAWVKFGLEFCLSLLSRHIYCIYIAAKSWLTSCKRWRKLE